MIDNEMLRQEYLTGIIQEFRPHQLALKKSGILPVVTELGQTASWDIEVTPRTILGFSGDHSPAKPLPLSGIKQQTAKLGVIRVSKNMLASIFMDIREPGSELRQQNAKKQIAKEEKEFALAMDRTEEFLIASALQGSITTTVDDLEIAPIDYGIPAGNKFVYNSGTPSLNIGDWRDPSTNLAEAIERIKTAARESSGYELTRAYFSGSMQADMIQSEGFKDFVKSTPTGAAAAAEGSLGRFQGLNWYPLDHSYKNASGVVTRYLAKNKIIFTPEPDTDWGFLRYGSMMVPNAAMDGFVEVMGRNSYSGIQINPPGLTLYAGLCLLPVLPKPGAIVLATASAA